MIVKTQFFDDYVAAVNVGSRPTQPTVGSSYRIKGYSLHLEVSLHQSATAASMMASMETGDVRFFYPASPAKRIRDSLYIISLIKHGRLVELFCAEVHGGMVVLAIFANDAAAAYRLIDMVFQGSSGCDAA